MKQIYYSAAILFLLFFSTACGDEDDAPTDTDQDTRDQNSDGSNNSNEPSTCEATEPECQDQSILELTLFDEVSPAEITDESEDDGSYFYHIDTTGGGLQPTQSYVYARFVDNGLEKVEISDEEAFTSIDWDIALRRFVIRVNSGVSGPSCVTVGQSAEGTLFDDLTEVPNDLEFVEESYFDDQCTFVSGHPFFPTPDTQTVSFWEYPVGCVQMTGQVFVLSLANGRYVKLEVASYYEPAEQTTCNETGEVSAPTSGNTRIRWDYID